MHSKKSFGKAWKEYEGDLKYKTKLLDATATITCNKSCQSFIKERVIISLLKCT